MVSQPIGRDTITSLAENYLPIFLFSGFTVLLPVVVLLFALLFSVEQPVIVDLHPLLCSAVLVCDSFITLIFCN